MLVRIFTPKFNPVPECNGVGVLRFFMEEQGLSRSDLPEVGPQRVVSAILNGTRDLSVMQIRALAKRFKVSPAVFI